MMTNDEDDYDDDDHLKCKSTSKAKTANKSPCSLQSTHYPFIHYTCTYFVVV